MTKPVPIIKFNGERASLDVKAIRRIFQKVGDRPFALISINGMFRTGKSLMLNFFKQYLNAKGQEDWFEPTQLQQYFHWRGGAASDTSGIDIWPEPFLLQGSDGQEICVFLMDTQGSFDSESSVQTNAVIFAISALLSSSINVNVVKDISEDVLQFFQYFCSFAQLVMEAGKNEDQDQMFQRLVFLVRDFQHIQDFKLGYHSSSTPQSNNFKKYRLDPNNSRQNENNFTRKQLAKTVANVGVYLLPYPGNRLATQDNLERLEEDFSEYVKAFVEFTFSEKNLDAKKVGGLQVTGHQFLQYVEAWAKIFDSDNLPQIQTLYGATATVQHGIAMKSGLANYDMEMRTFLDAHPDGVSQQIFTQEHQRIAENSLKVYRSMMKMGGQDYESKFCKELQTEMNRRMEQCEKINLTKFQAAAARKASEDCERRLADQIKQAEIELQAMKNAREEEKKKFQKNLETMQKQHDQVKQDLQDSKNEHLNTISKLEEQLKNVQKSNDSNFFTALLPILGQLAVGITKMIMK